jgi:hypothetical protein
MEIRIRVHRWVVWWLYIGIAIGVVAMGNILGRDLTRSQIKIILFLGVIHWVLGGLVCYARHAIHFEYPSEAAPPDEAPKRQHEKEWHAASTFLLPGGRKSVLPPRY